MIVVKNDFQIIKGEPEQKSIHRKSGKSYYGYFCPACANPIYGEPVDSTGVMVLRPGSLDDTHYLQPQAHIWIQEKQPWVNIADDIPSFEKGYDLYKVWPESSLQRLQQLKK